MVKFGYVSSEGDRLTECLHFFGTPNIDSWKQRYSSELSSVNFRTSLTFDSQPAAIAAWIRMGEIQTEDIVCAPWDAKLFKQALTKIRSLTRQKDPLIFIPKLKEICASCGVTVGIVRTPTGCSASGATKFINPNRALLLLSFRHLSDDQFWFTFFHEAGHLLLHGKDSLFIEEKQQNDMWDEREKEANDFSAEILIPSEFRYELSKIPLHKRGIVNFSIKVGISPGIVIGQMQFSGRIRFNQLNSFKRKYKWED
jgi:HTH-type transcriptional regulator/antitoxin HigA